MKHKHDLKSFQILEEDSLIQSRKNKPWRQSTGSKESKVKGHKIMARHISQERQRLGGNFVVAQTLESKLLRDAVKEITGPDTIFIALCLDAELQAKHLEHRLPGYPKVQESLKSNFHYYSPAEIDEPNTFNVQVTMNKTPSDLAEEILSLVDNKVQRIKQRHPKDTIVQKSYEDVLEYHSPSKPNEIQSFVGHKWTDLTVEQPHYVYLLLVWILFILCSLSSKVYGFRMIRSCQRLSQMFKNC